MQLRWGVAKYRSNSIQNTFWSQWRRGEPQTEVCWDFLLLLNLAVTAHEAVNATGGVNKLVLACVERVRGVGNLDLHHWISLTFKFHGLICLACGLCKEHIAVGHILEYDGAIVFGMDTFFIFF